MAELKKFEYIIEFEPYYMENESGEVLAVMTGMGYRTAKDFAFESLM